MILLRRVIGDALRARRQEQHRTLREVSTAANVSLGYLSEIERGQKEASSELLAAVCHALGARLSEVLREVSDTVASVERVPGMRVPAQEGAAGDRVRPAVSQSTSTGATVEPAAGAEAPAGSAARVEAALRVVDPGVAPRLAGRLRSAEDATVTRLSDGGARTVSVRPGATLKATLLTARRTRKSDQDRDRDILCVG